MNLLKFDPLYNSKSIGDFMDNFFNRSISDMVGTDFTLSYPSVNVIENESAFILELAAPGLEKTDFDIKVENDSLVISAKKEKVEETRDGKYSRREFNYSEFKRSFSIPDTINKESVAAQYENGVLKINLNKNTKEEEEQKGRTIEIL